MTLEMWDSLAEIWVAEPDLPEVNSNMVETDLSTIQKLQTATGGRARLIPIVKSNPEPIESLFMYQTTLKNTIQGYKDNAYRMRITMHTGRIFIDYFVKLSATWRAWLGDTQKYLLSATFDVVSSEGG